MNAPSESPRRATEAGRLTTGHNVAPCCTASVAWAWCLDLAEAALTGDPDAARCLSAAVQHYLAAVRREGVRHGQ